MEREIVKIDREKCDGCGNCVPNCHEGALQIIDDKAVLVSELMCDGLGACIGHCPQDAITIETREAEAYDEVAVVKQIIPNGLNTLLAHLKHLKDHNEKEYLHQAFDYLRNNHKNDFDVEEIINKVKGVGAVQTGQLHVENHGHHHGGGCPGSKAMSFGPKENSPEKETADTPSQLRQWPVQMHLVNPGAGYFVNSDLLVTADCVAYAAGNYHSQYLKGKSLVILCPKLDSNREVYVQKFIQLIDQAKVNTITVMQMEVPCCSGVMQMIKAAQEQTTRKVPVKVITVGIQGDILDESWDI